MVIYLDVLILINLYVTYFQILAVSVFTHRKSIWYRKLSAAGIGAVASLSIFIPQEMVLTLTLLKIFLCALIAFVAFGYTCICCERAVFDACQLRLFGTDALRVAVCRSYEDAVYKRHCIFRY